MHKSGPTSSRGGLGKEKPYLYRLTDVSIDSPYIIYCRMLIKSDMLPRINETAIDIQLSRIMLYMGNCYDSVHTW